MRFLIVSHFDCGRGTVATEDELRLEVENVDLGRLLAQAGLDAADQKVAERLQRLVLEELHHRVIMSSYSLSTPGRSCAIACLNFCLSIGMSLFRIAWTPAPTVNGSAVVRSSTPQSDRQGGQGQSVCGGPSSSLSLALSIAIRRSASARVSLDLNASSS